MDVKAIRDALVATLSNIPNTRVTTARDLINPPHLVVWGPDPITYGETFDAGHHLTFDVRLLVDRASDRVSDDTIDSYASDTGTSSVYATVEAHKTLGGAVMSAQVVSAQNRGAVEYNGVTYAALEFTVDVMT